MHRTLSIDYVVVVSGELEMELDSGEVVRLEPGEVVIQRGGKHVWRDPSPNIACRIMVCMIEAQPITINGKTLGPTPTWMMVVSSLWALLTRNRRGNVTQASETTTRRSLPGSVRRIVTTHDKAGNTAVLSAQEMPLPAWPGAAAAGALLWSTGNVPACNSDRDLEGDKRNVGMTLHGGSVFRVTVLEPEFTTPMHRTRSIDYCIVLSGEVELVLDGEKPSSWKQAKPWCNAVQATRGAIPVGMRRAGSWSA